MHQERYGTMAVTRIEEFRREAVRIALSSGSSRTRVAADLARENERLRLEKRVLREERVTCSPEMSPF